MIDGGCDVKICAVGNMCPSFFQADISFPKEGLSVFKTSTWPRILWYCFNDCSGFCTLEIDRWAQVSRHRRSAANLDLSSNLLNIFIIARSIINRCNNATDVAEFSLQPCIQVAITTHQVLKNFKKRISVVREIVCPNLKTVCSDENTSLFFDWGPRFAQSLSPLYEQLKLEYI